MRHPQTPTPPTRLLATRAAHDKLVVAAVQLARGDQQAAGDGRAVHHDGRDGAGGGGGGAAAAKLLKRLRGGGGDGVGEAALHVREGDGVVPGAARHGGGVGAAPGRVVCAGRDGVGDARVEAGVAPVVAALEADGLRGGERLGADEAGCVGDRGGWWVGGAGEGACGLFTGLGGFGSACRTLHVCADAVRGTLRGS